MFRNPFRITLDVKLDIGADRERHAMLTQIGEGSDLLDSAAVYAHLRGRAVPLFAPVVNDRERLALTEAQVASIIRLGDRYGATRDSILGGLAGYLASRRGDVDNSETQERWHAALRAIIWAEWLTASPLRALLDEAQAAKVFSRVGPLSTRRVIMERAEVERYLKAWLLAY
ncbi:MAG: hypothetical protein JWM95_2599 [Gemmatimonadetes bacterium]|nr:hypothetical protein [Gemmatimonadota bacterium]